MAQATQATSTGVKIKKQSGFVSSKPTGWTSSDGKDFPFISESLSAEFDSLEVSHSQNRTRQKTQGGPLGRETVGGDFDTFVDTDQIGYLLYSLFGSVTAADINPTATPDGTDDKYTFTVGDTLPHLALGFKYGTQSEYKIAYNCMIDSASFDFADEMLTVTWSVVGANLDASDTSSSVAYDFSNNNDWVNFKQASVKVTQDGGTEQTLGVRSASLDLANNVDDSDFVLGQTQLNSIVAGMFEANGSIEVVYETENADLNDWFEGSKKADIKIRYAKDETSESEDYIEFQVNNTWVTSNEVAMASQELIVRSLQFEAVNEDNTNYDVCKVVLFNNKDRDYSTFA